MAHLDTRIKTGQHLSTATQIKKGERLSRTTEFKKGSPPWNKGLRGYKMPKTASERHWSWRGNKVSYPALHTWVNRYKGKAIACDLKDETCRGKFEWSNISHKYKRDLSDFWQLCSSHHVRYDRKEI